MAIHLHVAGRLVDPADAERARAFIAESGRVRGWEVDELSEDGDPLVVLQPDPRVKWTLRFDGEGAFADRVDTGLADAAVHRDVGALLRAFQGEVPVVLDVFDESGWWESGDDRLLQRAWEEDRTAAAAAALKRARDGRTPPAGRFATAAGVIAMGAAALAVLGVFVETLGSPLPWIVIAVVAFLFSGALRPRTT